MKEIDSSFEPGLGSIPVKGTKCWYVRSSMVAHKFVVYETQWIGGMSDLLRLAKGNVFLSEKEANEVEAQLNSRLEKLKAIMQSDEFKMKQAENEARKKAEAAECKRKREEYHAARMAEKEATVPDGSPSGPSTKDKKSLHPDIIV